MSHVEDPEVIADLKFRAYTERDRSRGGADYDWKQPETIGAWKCRVPACGVLVGVTQDAMERVAMFNRELHRRGEAPLDINAIVYCDRCRDEFKRTAADRRRGQVDRMADVIRQLKAGEQRIRVRSKDGERILDEREAFLQLKEWGHPDVEGLRQCLDDKKKAAGGKRERKGTL